LTIDPSLAFSTYFGGSGEDEAEGIAVYQGNAYVAGRTNSINFPVSTDVEQGKSGGGFDVFVSELATDPPSLVFSTYLGGSQDDEATALVLAPSTPSAYIFVTGTTSSPNFPIAPSNAAQNKFGGGTQDAFVTLLNPAGSMLVYSTYLGGSDSDNGSTIAIDEFGDAWVGGGTFSTDFPTRNPFQATNQGGEDGFITEVSPDGTQFLTSTYLGGNQNDRITGLAEFLGYIYVTGATMSPDFPVTQFAFQTRCGSDGNCNGGLDDAFVTQFGESYPGQTLSLLYSTFLGGSAADEALGIYCDGSESLWLVGQTLSPDFPTTPGAFQTKCGTDGNCNGGKHDVFLTSMNLPAGNYPGTLNYSYLGGSGDDVGTAVTQDWYGDIYVTGRTDSTDFPTAPAIQPPFQLANGGEADAFVTVFNPDGSGTPPLLFSSYLGGSGTENSKGGSSANGAIGAIALDVLAASGSLVNVYLAGGTNSTDFSVVFPLPGQQTYQGGASDAFVTQVSAVLPLDAVTVSVTDYITCVPYAHDYDQCPPNGSYGIGATLLKPAFSSSFLTYTDTYKDSYLFYSGAHVALSGAFPVFWGGACSGYSLTCNLIVNGPTNVSAIYGPFSLSASPATATVAAGSSVTSVVTVSALSGSGYSGTVSLSCALSWQQPFVPPPQAPTCSVSPASVNLVNGGSATATMTVYTTPNSAAMALPGLRREVLRDCGFWLPISGFVVSGIFVAGDCRKKKKLFAMPASLLFAALVLMTACGGGPRGGGRAGVGGTPSGAYTMLVTGTAADNNYNTGECTVTVD
jgi:hypothetical protein